MPKTINLGIHKIQAVPHPQASVVIEDGTFYLIDKVNMNTAQPKYALIGHSDWQSEGRGHAWVKHDDLVLYDTPSRDNWGRLMAARSYEPEDEDE